MHSIQTRRFTESDIPQVLALMKGLARFEGYLDDFRVTEDDLRQYGLGTDPRFEVWVAHGDEAERLLGLAVIYTIPWTYDLRPTLILKELFVAEDARGQRVGDALMRAVARRAVEQDCPRLQWTVLASNEAAKRFYTRLGGGTDPVWEHWGLGEEGLNNLAGEGP